MVKVISWMTPPSLLRKNSAEGRQENQLNYSFTTLPSHWVYDWVVVFNDFFVGSSLKTWDRKLDDILDKICRYYIHIIRLFSHPSWVRIWQKNSWTFSSFEKTHHLYIYLSLSTLARRLNVGKVLFTWASIRITNSWTPGVSWVFQMSSDEKNPLESWLVIGDPYYGVV